MAKYSKGAQERVEEALHREKKGTLKSGSGQKVTNPKHAIAIALSEARAEGEKVPKKTAAKKATPKGAAAKKETPKKSGSKEGNQQKAAVKKAVKKVAAKKRS